MIVAKANVTCNGNGSMYYIPYNILQKVLQQKWN